MSGGAIPRWVIGITGASGIRYALRLLDVLADRCERLDVIVSDSALRVLQEEEGLKLSQSGLSAPALIGREASSLVFHSPRDIAAEVASGSARYAGLVIVPCSMASVGAIASGAHSHLIHRVADVALKERRRLIVVPRETPLSLIHLRNLVTLAEAGATILPAMPGFYHRPDSLADIIDMLVMKITDAMGLDIDLVHRWGSAP